MNYLPSWGKLWAKGEKVMLDEVQLQLLQVRIGNQRNCHGFGSFGRFTILLAPS